MPTTAVVEAATVLREELRPPRYGTQFISEDASRTFYTKYLEYKRCVERANLGSAVQYQLVPMSQLVNMPAQKRLARWLFNKVSITPQQLEEAIETHAGHEETEDDSQGCLPEREADARLAEVPRQGSV